MDPKIGVLQDWAQAEALEAEIFESLPAYFQALRASSGTKALKHLQVEVEKLLISGGAGKKDGRYSLSSMPAGLNSPMSIEGGEEPQLRQREMTLLVLLLYLRRDHELQLEWFGSLDDRDLDNEERALQALEAKKRQLAAPKVNVELMAAQKSKVESLSKEVSLLRRRVTGLIFMVSKLTNTSERLNKPLKEWLSRSSHLLQLEGPKPD